MGRDMRFTPLRAAIPPRRSSAARGYTMMELLMAMSIFSLLGLLVVVLMRQGMTVFTSGTRGGLLQDRSLAPPMR